MKTTFPLKARLDEHSFCSVGKFRALELLGHNPEVNEKNLTLAFHTFGIGRGARILCQMGHPGLAGILEKVLEKTQGRWRRGRFHRAWSFDKGVRVSIAAFLAYWEEYSKP